MNTLERFEAKVSPEPNTGCWLWTAAADDLGYGRFTMPPARTVLAHRASWMLYRGPIPPGRFVCHHCDMPCCVNPAHLFVGVAQDNVSDMVAKGRNPKRTTNGRALLSEVEVRLVRAACGFISRQALSEILGVHRTTVSLIARGVNWPDLSKPLKKERRR